MIKFIDPRGKVATPIKPYELSKNVRENEGDRLSVALLANGFPDSELFFKKLGEAIERRLPKISTKLWNKGNAGVEASDALADEIIADCQVVIAAYGH